MQQVKAEKFTESVVEDAALAWLNSLGYAVLHLPVRGTQTRKATAAGRQVARTLRQGAGIVADKL